MQKDPKTTSRRLGRGLQALLSDTDQPGETIAPQRIPVPVSSELAMKPVSDGSGSGFRFVEIGRLRPNPFQPRQEMDPEAIDELAKSIAEAGIIQPILVRSTEKGHEIIAGERRWRAARKAGLKTVPVIARDASDEQMLELAIIENIHRRDLNAIERAQAYRRYCEVFELPAEQVARRLGENRTTVVNYVRLLDLPREVRDMVASGKLSAGHARSILGIDDDQRRAEMARTAINLGWSVRTLEKVVRREKTPKNPPKPEEDNAESEDAHIQQLEQRFTDRFKSRVEIHMSDKPSNKGRVVLMFSGITDFERIAELSGVDVNLANEK